MVEVVLILSTKLILGLKLIKLGIHHLTLVVFWLLTLWCHDILVITLELWSILVLHATVDLWLVVEYLIALGLGGILWHKLLAILIILDGLIFV